MPGLAKAGVEPFGPDGAEQLLDHPAPAVEPGDPPGPVVHFDPVAGQQPPVCRLDPRRRVAFARLDEEDGLGLRHAGLCGPVSRAPERDRAETHRDAGRARLLTGPGRQVHRMLLLRPAFQAVEELAPAVGEDAVLRGQAEKRPCLGLHRDRGVADHARAAAAVAEVRRVPSTGSGQAL